MRRWLAGLLLCCAIPVEAGNTAWARQLASPPFEGLRGDLILDSGGAGGMLHSDLRGRMRLRLGGVTLELRDGEAWSVEPGGQGESRLDAFVAAGLRLHDFFAIGLETVDVVRDGEGRVERSEDGLIAGYRVGHMAVRFLEWQEFEGVDVPAAVWTSDPSGQREYRITNLAAVPMPPRPGEPEARWVQEPALPPAAQDALAAERAFAATAVERGTKAAFLEWLVEGGTVFGPGPVTVESRYAGVPDAAAEQSSLHWSPEWILCAGSQDLAAISGRWEAAAAGATEFSAFGQYLSIWHRTDDGWRVLADGGISLEEPRPLTGLATGRVVLPRPATAVPDADDLAPSLERDLEERAFRDGYAAALAALAVPDVLGLRDGREPVMDPASLQVDPSIAGLAPRIEMFGSAESAARDLVATWGVLHFTASDGTASARGFLRVWEPGPARWQIAIDLHLSMPTGEEP